MKGMPELRQLTYERQPPLGNALIDDEAGSVFIRLFPDRTFGRAISWVFIAGGIAVFCFAISQTRPTLIGILQSVPVFFASALFFLLAMTFRYNPRDKFTTITATPNGVELCAGEFAPRVIERTKIRRVFTRDTPFSKRMSLVLQLQNGSEVVIGDGSRREIDIMAKALHRVLNYVADS
jgi:hypothetical protein